MTITSAERNRAYRARHANDPAYRARERRRVADWREERRAAGLPLRAVSRCNALAAHVGTIQRRARAASEPQRFARGGFREAWEAVD